MYGPPPIYGKKHRFLRHKRKRESLMVVLWNTSIQVDRISPDQHFSQSRSLVEKHLKVFQQKFHRTLLANPKVMLELLDTQG